MTLVVDNIFISNHRDSLKPMSMDQVVSIIQATRGQDTLMQLALWRSESKVTGVANFLAPETSCLLQNSNF